MMPSLDKRLNDFINSLEEKHNIQISKDMRTVLTKDITVGYHPSKTFEAATATIEERLESLMQPEAV